MLCLKDISIPIDVKRNLLRVLSAGEKKRAEFFEAAWHSSVPGSEYCLYYLERLEVSVSAFTGLEMCLDVLSRLPLKDEEKTTQVLLDVQATVSLIQTTEASQVQLISARYPMVAASSARR